MNTRFLPEGRRVLVVEDEMNIVLIIEEALRNLGAQVIGPVSRLDAALRLANEEAVDAAILDVNIRGGNSYAVADVLVARGIPFVFCSGYSDWALAEQHRDRPRLAKPYSSKDLEGVVVQLLGALTI